MKLNKHSLKERAADLVFCIVGAAFFSCAVNFFASANNISLGGFTGVSTLINYLVPSIPVGVLIFALNVPLFVLAYIKLGGGFIAKTAFFTAVYSVAIDIGAQLLPRYEGDKLLACIFCGVFSGAGLACAFLRGATTGGTDIIAKLINLRHQHLSMGRLVLAIDVLVIISTGIVYKSTESAMYSAIVIYITSVLIDYILYGKGHGKLMLVVSSHGQALSQLIMAQLGRGVTVLSVKGGYTGDDKSMLLCAVRASETSRFYKIVRVVDEHAFTVVLEAGEILGEGFVIKHE